MTVMHDKTNLLGDSVDSVFNMHWKSSHFLSVYCYCSLVQPTTTWGITAVELWQVSLCHPCGLTSIYQPPWSSSNVSHMSLFTQNSPESFHFLGTKTQILTMAHKVLWFMHYRPPPTSLLIFSCSPHCSFLTPITYNLVINFYLLPSRKQVLWG